MEQMQVRLLRLAGWERVVSLLFPNECSWAYPGKMGAYSLEGAWAMYDARFLVQHYA